MENFELELIDVSVKYPSVSDYSLKNINLKIKKGEIVAIVGQSGSGKTSLVRTINGLSNSYYEAEVTGEIIFQGHDISQEEIGDIAQNIGTVFQNPRAQFFNLDTSAELIFGCENIGLPTKEIKNRISAVIKEFNLEELINRDIFYLSGGEKQRIAIAEVMAMGPEILLLDEVSSNLDITEIKNLKAQLQKMKNIGVTIIINEHRLYWLNDLVDTYVYLHNGEIKEIYAKNEFLKLSQEKLHLRGLRNTIMKFDVELNLKNTFDFKSESFSSLRNEGFQVDINDFDMKIGSLGIIGKNGSGKSTFVEGLLGLIKNKGSIFLNNKKIITSMCSYVMQDVTRQLFKESVKKEVLFYNNASEDMMENILKLLNLDEKRERHPQSLSGGEKQRVVIANSLLSGKQICIMDEPTSGLDYANMIALAKIIKILNEKEILVVVITHDFELLNLCCDTILEIEDGTGKIYRYEKERMQRKFDSLFKNL